MGRLERFPELAAELVRSRWTSLTAGPLAAKHATSTIPIVMIGAGDPVARIRLGLRGQRDRDGGPNAWGRAGSSGRWRRSRHRRATRRPAERTHRPGGAASLQPTSVRRSVRTTGSKPSPGGENRIRAGSSHVPAVCGRRRYSTRASTRAGADSERHLAGSASSFTREGIWSRLIRFSIWKTTRGRIVRCTRMPLPRISSACS
jgi:hypothetical protein